MLTKQDIISNKQSLPECSIIYFLIMDEEIVYVGQSINGISRIFAHMKDKKFNSYYYISVESRLLDIVEECYIKIFQPIYNKSKNPRYGYKDKTIDYGLTKGKYSHIT